MLQRMNELTVQSANGTNSSVDRDAIQAEIDQLTTEIDSCLLYTSHPLIAVSIVGCIAGMYLLCMSGGFAGIYMGDVCEFLCAVGFMCHILTVEHFAKADGIKLSCIQFAVCAIPVSYTHLRTKYFAYANNCYLEMINATDAGAEAFCISYSFGSLSEEEIYSVFTDCLKTLGATDEEIEKTIADFTTNNDGDYMIEGYETTSSITCTYCPCLLYTSK